MYKYFIIIVTILLLLTIITNPYATEWSKVHVNLSGGGENWVNGPQRAFRCSRPPLIGEKQAPWKVYRDLRGHFTGAKKDSINVYSAKRISFNDFHISCADTGYSSHITFKFIFNESITSFTWDPPPAEMNFTQNASLMTQYSEDCGVTWKNIHTYPSSFVGNYTPERKTVRVDYPVSSMLFRWIANVPPGEKGYWNIKATGLFIFSEKNGLPAPMNHLCFYGNDVSNDNFLKDEWDEPMVVVDTSKYYTSIRPAHGAWSESINLANGIASLKGEKVKLYSANKLVFNRFNIVSGNAGESTHMVIKIKLSEPIIQARWDLGPLPDACCPNAHALLRARFSSDGRTWYNAHQYQDSNTLDAGSKILKFTAPTKALYLGFFADVGTGGNAFYGFTIFGHISFFTAKDLDNWKTLTNNFMLSDKNKVYGPNETYVSTRPVRGPWQCNFDLRNHFANSDNYSILVNQANNISFNDYHISSSDTRYPSRLAFKISLSEPVKSINWELGPTDLNLSAGVTLKAIYSVDGINWESLYVYPQLYSGIYTSGSVTCNFQTPISSFYFGWLANVPPGKNGYWSRNSSGLFTFTPALKREVKSNVYFNLKHNPISKVEGPKKYYQSTKPAYGEWCFDADLRNYFANVKNYPISYYSASNILFHDYHLSVADSLKESELAFKIKLSEPITTAFWYLGNDHRSSPDLAFKAEYSTNGLTWNLATNDAAASQTITLNFPIPTQFLYVRWKSYFLRPSQYCWWKKLSIGKIILIPESMEKKGDLEGPRLINSDFFGTTVHFLPNPWVPPLKDLGENLTVRVDLPYEWFSKNVYSLGPFPLTIKNAFTNNIQILTVITNHNVNLMEKGVWPLKKDNGNYINFYKTNLTAIANTVQDSSFPKYWQIGNEYPMSVWREQYTDLLKYSHEALKASNPANKIVTFGLAGTYDHLQLQAIYRHGGKKYFDIIAGHPYTTPLPPEEGGLIREIGKFWQVMKENNDYKPLWITEIGWAGLPSGLVGDTQGSIFKSEEEQAIYLARTYLIASSIPFVEKVFCFNFVQGRAGSSYDPMKDKAHDPFMGLMDGDTSFTKKPSHYAVATIYDEIVNWIFVKRVRMKDNNIWVYRYDKPSQGKGKIAIWSINGAKKIRLSGKSALDSIHDVYGKNDLPSNNHTLFLPENGGPLYISGDRASIDRFEEDLPSR